MLRPTPETIGEHLIREERLRHIEENRFDGEAGELTSAARCFEQMAHMGDGCPAPISWPWEPHTWEPSADPGRNLTHAGALFEAAADAACRSTDWGNAAVLYRMAKGCAAQIDAQLELVRRRAPP